MFDPPSEPNEALTVERLRRYGLMEMKATGQWGLTAEGWELAKALRVLDDLYSEVAGAPRTRRDVKRPQRTAPETNKRGQKRGP